MCQFDSGFNVYKMVDHFLNSFAEAFKFLLKITTLVIQVAQYEIHGQTNRLAFCVGCHSSRLPLTVTVSYEINGGFQTTR